MSIPTSGFLRVQFTRDSESCSSFTFQPVFALSLQRGRQAGVGCNGPLGLAPTRGASQVVPCVFATHFNPCAIALLQKHVSF